MSVHPRPTTTHTTPPSNAGQPPAPKRSRAEKLAGKWDVMVAHVDTFPGVHSPAFAKVKKFAHDQQKYIAENVNESSAYAAELRRYKGNLKKQFAKQIATLSPAERTAFKAYVQQQQNGEYGGRAYQFLESAERLNHPNYDETALKASKTAAAPTVLRTLQLQVDENAIDTKEIVGIINGLPEDTRHSAAQYVISRLVKMRAFDQLESLNIWRAGFVPCIELYAESVFKADLPEAEKKKRLNDLEQRMVALSTQLSNHNEKDVLVCARWMLQAKRAIQAGQFDAAWGLFKVIFENAFDTSHGSTSAREQRQLRAVFYLCEGMKLLQQQKAYDPMLKLAELAAEIIDKATDGHTGSSQEFLSLVVQMLLTKHSALLQDLRCVKRVLERIADPRVQYALCNEITQKLLKQENIPVGPLMAIAQIPTPSLLHATIVRLAQAGRLEAADGARSLIQDPKASWETFKSLMSIGIEQKQTAWVVEKMREQCGLLWNGAVPTEDPRRTELRKKYNIAPKRVRQEPVLNTTHPERLKEAILILAQGGQLEHAEALLPAIADPNTRQQVGQQVASYKNRPSNIKIKLK